MIDKSVLQIVQFEHLAWSRKNFPLTEAHEPLLGVVEEVGELAHAHLKARQKIRNNQDHEEAGKDAVGDILIYLVHYCNIRGWDVEKILDDTWVHVSGRNWVKYPETGFPEANEAPMRSQPVRDDIENRISRMT